MTLTAARCLAHIEHTLAGRLSPELAGLDVLNEAGEWLCNAHPWEWLQSASASLDFVQDQNFVALPTNIYDLTAINMTNGLQVGFELTSLPFIIDRRTQEIGNTLYFWGRVHYHQVAGGEEPIPVLELWPAPTSAQTDAITIFYRAGWTKITGDTAKVPVPSWMDSVVIQCVRAFARGYEEEDEERMETRLDTLASSSLWRAATLRDGALQADLGDLQGGAAQQSMRGITDRHWRFYDVNQPTT
jgi:hypothetical protein